MIKILSIVNGCHLTRVFYHYEEIELGEEEFLCPKEKRRRKKK
jgi:hypothetical protein